MKKMAGTCWNMTCPRCLSPVPAGSIRVHVDETTQLGCEGVLRVMGCGSCGGYGLIVGDKKHMILFRD